MKGNLLEPHSHGQQSQKKQQIYGGFATSLWKNDESKPYTFGSRNCFLFNLTQDKKIVAKNQA
jgi:hypothetical protein